MGELDRTLLLPPDARSVYIINLNSGFSIFSFQKLHVQISTTKINIKIMP